MKGLNERKKMHYFLGVYEVMSWSNGRLNVDDGRDGYYGTDITGRNGNGAVAVIMYNRIIS